MTLTEIKGNLFYRKLKPNTEYYVHCISRDYACGAGIAKEFNKRYNLTNRLQSLPREKCMIVDNVMNLVTKSKYWQKPTYDSLREALEEVNYKIMIFNLHRTPESFVRTLVMPKIGCGLDKLQWKNVKKMLKEVFADTDINVEVYCL